MLASGRATQLNFIPGSQLYSVFKRHDTCRQARHSECNQLKRYKLHGTSVHSAVLTCLVIKVPAVQPFQRASALRMCGQASQRVQCNFDVLRTNQQARSCLQGKLQAVYAAVRPCMAQESRALASVEGL